MRSSAWLLGLLACTGEPRELVDPGLWTEVTAADDPFDDRPEEVDCPSSAWGLEPLPRPALEIETGVCGYLVVAQPSLARLRNRDEVHLLIGHDQLEADAPALSHAAVRIGDELIWETEDPIPSDPVLHDVTLDVSAAPEGTPILFHLHNHGANTWAVYEISAVSRGR